MWVWVNFQKGLHSVYCKLGAGSSPEKNPFLAALPGVPSMLVSVVVQAAGQETPPSALIRPEE